MKTNFPLPVKVLDSINQKVLNDYPNWTIKQQQNLETKLIQLWLYIYQRELHDTKTDQLVFTYCRIHYTDLKKFKLQTPKVIQYPELIKFLESINLIKVNHNFINGTPGSFPKGYKIQPEFCAGLTREVIVDFSKILKATKSKEYYLELYPEYTKLINDTYSSSISLDQYFYDLEKRKGEILSQKLKKYPYTAEVVLDDMKILEFKLDAIKFNFQNIWFSVSSTGRFYSSATNLSNTVTKFIKIGNTILNELDAANCQPLLLNTLIDNPSYKKSCEDGNYYEDLTVANGYEWNETNRAITKSKCISLYFDDRLLNDKQSDFLNVAFPGLSEQLNSLKNPKVYNKKTKKYEQTSNDEDMLWFKLQSIESSIFINVALNAQFPTITRHDSIFTLPEHSEELLNMLKIEFNNIGLNATIKKK